MDRCVSGWCSNAVAHRRSGCSGCELPEGSRGWVVSESAGGVGAAGAATVVVVDMEGEMVSPNVAAFLTECTMAGFAGRCSSQP